MFTQILHLFISIVFFIAILHPDQAGYWKAQFDISHESIMNEYYADCDCTELLE